MRDDKKAALRSDGTWNTHVAPPAQGRRPVVDRPLVSMVKNADNERSGFVGIHRDITELQRSQELLEDSHERLRNLAARLLVVREQERSAIARELHDELGQALTRLNIDLSWLTRQLPQRLQTPRVASMAAARRSHAADRAAHLVRAAAADPRRSRPRSGDRVARAGVRRVEWLPRASWICGSARCRGTATATSPSSASCRKR